MKIIDKIKAKQNDMRDNRSVTVAFFGATALPKGASSVTRRVKEALKRFSIIKARIPCGLKKF